MLKNGTPIAMKKLRIMPGIDDMQFENELCHLKRLKHENIVQIVGFCDETEQEIVPYKGRLVVADIIHRVICLEFVPNGSLGKILSGMLDRQCFSRVRCHYQHEYLNICI